MKTNWIMFVAAGLGLSCIVAGSGESRGKAIGDQLLSRIRGGDQYSRNVNTEVCAAANVVPPQQTAGDCANSPIPDGECIDCGTQPSLEMGTPSRLENQPGICCCAITRKVGTCWRSAPNYVYTCTNAVVDDQNPTCMGGIYWTNYSQHQSGLHWACTRTFNNDANLPFHSRQNAPVLKQA